MLSIVYSSAAQEDFAPADLQGLLVQSRRANEQAGLTGLLVYRDGRFLQLLEGEDETVRATMHAIETDARHGQIRVLLEDRIESRQFPDWTMGYTDLTDGSVDVPGYRRTFDDIDSDRSVSGTLPALRALIAWFRERHDA
ncbi:BLUF domain-containing protein [Amnibacterium kyonggiense]